MQLRRSLEEVVLLVWEKEQALYYYEKLLEAVADMAARRAAQALSSRDIALAELNIVYGSELEADRSYEELSFEQRDTVAAHLRVSESFHAQAIILGRKLKALQELQADAIRKLQEIKPQ